MRAKTSAFVAEFPLCTIAADEAALPIRLDAERNVYNASLGESHRRLALMRESLDWQRARSMPAMLGTNAKGKPILKKLHWRVSAHRSLSRGRIAGLSCVPWIARAARRTRATSTPKDRFGKVSRGGTAKRYRVLAVKCRERDRRMAAERKRSHGELANRILEQGTAGNAGLDTSTQGGRRWRRRDRDQYSAKQTEPVRSHDRRIHQETAVAADACVRRWCDGAGSA
jgi:hypothetical protein